MNNEYVIINKTELLKRIEELEESLVVSEANNDSIRAGIETFKIEQLEWCLSQSTPLIPEIEKAFDAGYIRGYDVGHGDARTLPLEISITKHIHNDKQNYISNLKLDI
jgi:hypothetical protein